MTELEYIVHNFNRNFHKYKGRRIVLSPGEYLEPVVRKFDREYRFDSILGTECAEVPDGTDVVILTDRRTGKEPDYNRIRRSCEEKGVTVLDLFGLDQLALHRELAGHRHLTIMQWKDLLSEYDVVSLFIPHVAADFDEGLGRWVLRQRFPILFNWLKSRGKTVVIFWETEDQLQPLVEAGIDTAVPLLRREGNDLGFLKLAGNYAGRRIIHIGVGTVRDGIVPREYGLDSRVNRYFTNVVSSAGGSAGVCEDREQLIRAVDRHDVVSFDLFDTLLKRTVLFPEDVFAMVEERTGIREFAGSRYRIQKECPQMTLEEIYECLQEKCGYDSRTLERLKQTELAVESDVILPRKSLVEILNYAKHQGKTVVLVSDMYLDPEFLRQMLKRCGIDGYSALYLSCEYRKLKQEGLFEILQDEAGNGKTILHVGNDPYSDVEAAERYGLDAVLVPGCREMAERNGYGEAIKRCGTLGERKLLGLGIAAAFDDPFRRDGDAQIAGMIVSPLVMGYLQWVRGEMKDREYDRFLLFSRDGWMLTDAYEKLRQKAPNRMPQALYFYVNRHAALLTVMDDFELVKDRLMQSGDRDDPPKLLGKMLRIPEDRLVPYQGEPLGEYYRKNQAVIRETAEYCRDNYRRYLEREGLRDGKYAVMDFISEGTAQTMLSRSLPGKMDGYYMGIPEYALGRPVNVSYYMDQDQLGYDTEMKLEVYFTSPEPALDCIGENGEPVFAEEVRDGKVLDRIRGIQETVRDHLDRYLEKLYDPSDEFDRDLIFRLCGAIDQYDVENFYYDDMTGQKIRTAP